MQLEKYNPYPSFRAGQEQSAREILEAMEAGHKIIEYCGPTGCGKCFQKNTKVVMFDGTLKNVQDIARDDVLMGPDSNPRNVLNISVGIAPLYKVSPIRGGESFTCTGNHILNLKRTNDGTSLSGSTINISIEDYIKKSKTFKHIYKLWHAERPIRFSKNSSPLPLPPYLLGIWLGDGTLKSPEITNPEPEIEQYLNTFVDHAGLSIRKYSNTRSQCPTFYIRGQQRGQKHLHSVWKYLKNFAGVYGEKCIPQEYKTSTIKERFQLLAGLLDSDGYYHKTGYEIIAKNDDLAADIAFVARSLGISVTTSKKTGVIKTIGFVGEYNRLNLTGDMLKHIPCLVQRKQPQQRMQKKKATAAGFSITPIGEQDFYGFELDGDHLFFLRDFTISHNSLVLTVVARALAEEGYPKATYSTPQRALVHQLSRDANLGITALLGRAAYPCTKVKSDSAGDCPVPAKLRRKTCPRCPYQAAKDAFLAAPLGATTLAKVLVDRSIPTPDILIVDEAQGLEMALIDQRAIQLPDCVDLADLEESVRVWSRDVDLEITKYEIKLERQFARIRPAGATDEITALMGFVDATEASKTAKQLEKIQRVSERAKGVLRAVQAGTEGYAISPKDRMFRLLDGRQQFQDMIMNIKLVILASGTPCTQLLVDDCAKIVAPHPIDVERRRVYYDPVGKMNFQEREKTIDVMGLKIADMHNQYHRNTMVHCHSFAIADILGNVIRDQGVRVKWVERKGREESIQAWKDLDDCCLMAVACEEGLDLAGEKYPLNIIAKVPFLPYRSDEWTDRRKARDNKLPADQRWENVSVALAIQQAAGRTTRGPEDFSETYILDSSFEFFYKKNYQLFQNWFRDSLLRKS